MTGDAACIRLRRDAPDDAILVVRAVDGDRWAWESLYRRHVHRVTTVVARLLRNRADVEDVVQDCFVEAFRDLHKLREPDQVGRWLVSVAVHKVHKRFRRRRLRRLLGLHRSLDDERLTDQAYSSASQEIRAELRLLDEALDAMSDADRSAWVLRHLLEYQLSEVADLTGCSLATAKRRIRKAQQRVDEHFESCRPSPEPRKELAHG
ncbi:MAG: RNA polymerase sigma factor [Myxococcota bacterium]